MDKKFDVYATYTRDEFISRMQDISSENPDDQRFFQMIHGHITWALLLPENATIHFEIQGEIIYPVANYPATPGNLFYSNQ